MTISDGQAVSFGALALCAEDMYANAVGSLAPPADPRIAAAGWSIVAYLTAQDALFPGKDQAERKLALRPERVFFGFVAQNVSDPTLFVAAIRGTDGIVEWAIDAEFALVPHPSHPEAKVEQGFWDIYRTMSLADPISDVTTHQDAADGVAQLVGAGSIVVAGHSLGAALATYFAEDLAERLGARACACLFASPQTGDAAWARLVDAGVGGYRLYNYVLDVVTHVPPLGYAALPRATVLQPSTAEAGVKLDIACNHHLLCYLAMIDFGAARSALGAPPDAGEARCVVGPSGTMPWTARALALLVNALGGADQRVLAILRALHKVSAV